MATYVTKPHKITAAEFHRGLIERPNDSDIIAEKERVARYISDYISLHEEDFRRLINTFNSSRSSVESAIVLANSSYSSIVTTARLLGSTSERLSAMILAINAYVPPRHLFDALNRTVETYRSLVEPMRAVVEVIARFQAPLIYERQPELRSLVDWRSYDTIPVDVRPRKTIEAELLRENNLLQKNIIRLQDEIIEGRSKAYVYDPQSVSILIKKVRYRPITFLTDRKDPKLGIFFSICMELLEVNGFNEGNFRKVYISKTEIRAGFATRGILNITDNQIYSIRSNIMRTKIVDLIEEVGLSDYQANKGGYLFWLRFKVEDITV